MRRFSKSLFSILIIISLFAASNLSFAAEAQTDLEVYLSYKNFSEKAVIEFVDGVRYVYFIEDGEACIVNIFTGFTKSGKKELVLPTTLGGCPVTSLGYNAQNSGMVEVFAYFNNGENESEYFPEMDGYSPEYDLAVYNVEREDALTLVIPEGYKFIQLYAMDGFSGFIKFPKSLKEFSHEWFLSEYFFGCETFIGESTFVFPESKYNAAFSFDMTNDSYIFPSRDPAVAVDLRGEAASVTVFSPNLCFPSNTDSTIIKFALYDYITGMPVSYYDGATIFCPPDSEFISVIEEMGGYTINTNVPVAEYIEFPDETVNIHVGDVVDLEAKTYPTDAIWTACDYEVSDPSIVKIDEYSGRITALKEGTVTVTATHCERGFVDTCTVNVVPEPVPGVNEIKPATDTPYYSYGNRDYTLDVTGSPSKIQVVRADGGTTTIDRRRAQVTSNGETETWIVNMRVEAGAHNIRAKYGNKWDDRLTPFTVTYDTPKAHSFDLACEKGMGTFEVVTDPQIIKVQFLLDNGCTLTYSQGNSYVAEDGLRHWVITRKIPANTNYTLKTKLGYVWTTTDLTVTS